MVKPNEILFIEWVAENHFRMVDIDHDTGESSWYSESMGKQNANELFELFKLEQYEKDRQKN